MSHQLTARQYLSYLFSDRMVYIFAVIFFIYKIIIVIGLIVSGNRAGETACIR